MAFVKLEITQATDGHYIVALTKSFDEDHGGGQQTFEEEAGHNIHSALDLARSMVTVSAAYRTDFSAEQHVAPCSYGLCQHPVCVAAQRAAYAAQSDRY